MNGYEKIDGYNKTGWIETFNGVAFRPMEPDPKLISISDVAHALSFKCRYTGHSKRFYSVAEHSVLMAHYAHEMGMAREVVTWCLLHDAVEAYLPDVPRPLKPFISNWREIEDNVEHAVAERFRLPLPTPPEVKELDTRILLTEAKHLMVSMGSRWQIDAAPLPVTIRCWSPINAEDQFHRMYRTLYPGPMGADPPIPSHLNVRSADFDPYREEVECHTQR